MIRVGSRQGVVQDAAVILPRICKPHSCAELRGTSACAGTLVGPRHRLVTKGVLVARGFRGREHRGRQARPLAVPADLARRPFHSSVVGVSPKGCDGLPAVRSVAAADACLLYTSDAADE